ncbi:GntR family transcriptional regulator [Flagellimonas nanhaiensis]|uniref:GntR family transcriptional regulator n=1 Tax=Flagellimonas nanhaiensis TaxID=2292706 RepID=A0A371JUT5_9FLAO|nr:GntR family transcriptional regulator [Allomuricauda nanhaiensis]RDY61574.1 GntR family transcriptional regulator [Allomuricauda nanhaiensis]
MNIDHTSSVPLHAQVEQLLRELIKEERYIQGEPLPKEVDLSKLLGVARNTIRQATNKLVYENAIVRKKGVGTFVVPNSLSTKLDNWSSFTAEMTQMGVQLKTYRMEASFVKADVELSKVLNIKEDKEVLELTRLRGDEDGPFVLFYSYFHPRVGLTGKEDFSKPLYQILETDYATRAVTSQEEIKAIAADEFLSQELQIPFGAPLLLRIRKVLDPGNRIIEYNLCYYRSDKFTYTIDIHRNQ